jgi:hypothetical protein
MSTDFTRGVEAAASMAEHWADELRDDSGEAAEMVALTLRDIADRMRKVLVYETPAPDLAVVSEAGLVPTLLHAFRDVRDCALARERNIATASRWMPDGQRAEEVARAVVAAVRADTDKYRRRAAQEGRKARQRGKSLRALSLTLARRYRDEVRVFRTHRDGLYRCRCWSCYADRTRARSATLRAEATQPVDLSALREAVRKYRALLPPGAGQAGDLAHARGQVHWHALALVDTTPAEAVGASTFREMAAKAGPPPHSMMACAEAPRSTLPDVWCSRCQSRPCLCSRHIKKDPDQ